MEKKIIGNVKDINDWLKWCEQMKEDPFKYGYTVTKLEETI